MSGQQNLKKMSKRESENKDSLLATESQPPKKLNLDESVSTTTEISDQSIEDFFILETKQYLLLHKIADNLELAILLTKMVAVTKPTALPTK